ncbi:hypothetical protein FH972_021826 [Carpinus fangiana]|uniref:Nephrocystin 3-like N-terminal domain-containing protein n=1 Tax=Carpinus fangiana TaxID=176857 RepID=A0A5N6KQF0_9ROSI|nr:hypothetical protein FH972_021826 [Carpinus fangiana]
MEAVAAIALTGNVLQFIGLGLKVVRIGGGIKRSSDGSMKDHEEISDVIKDLEMHILKLDACNDSLLDTLVTGCKDVATELKTGLSKVKKTPGKNVWSSYAQALRSIWNERKLHDMENRLNRLRDEIGFHQLNIMRNEIATITNVSISRDSRTQEAAEAIQHLQQSQNVDFGQLDEKLRSMVTSIFDRFDGHARATSELVHEVKELRRLQASLTQEPIHAVTRTAFLETLEFRGMDEREEIISDAHARTFDWLLLDSMQEFTAGESPTTSIDERQDLKSVIREKLMTVGVTQKDIDSVMPSDVHEQCPGASLQKWLSSGSGIFWIKGKPGCGKSTLMKAVLQKRRLKTALMKMLQTWSQGSTILMAKFFFFRPGSDFQKSFLGFLQSLIHQILNTRPDLIDTAFTAKAQMEAVARLQKSIGTDTMIWSVYELRTAFKSLQRKQDLRIFLHVDGIDEIECPPIKMVHMLKAISNGPNIKILAAGRWTPEFEEAFSLDHTLNLHTTTELDVLHYTVDKLLERDWKTLLTTATQFTIILKELINAAEGVFLWVAIVIDSLLHGLRHYENFPQLFSRLKAYPRSLDKLYQYLFASIEEEYAKDVAFWLLVVNRFPGGRYQPKITLLEMSRASMFDAKDISSLNRIVLDKSSSKSTVELLQKRMETRGRHFFDFVPPKATWRQKRPQFAHRTVMDFLAQPSIMTELQNLQDEDRDFEVFPIAAKISDILIDAKSNYHDSVKGGFVCVTLGGERLKGYREILVLQGERIPVAIYDQISFHLQQESLNSAFQPVQYLRPTFGGWVEENNCDLFIRLNKYPQIFMRLVGTAPLALQTDEEDRLKEMSLESRTDLILTKSHLDILSKHGKWTKLIEGEPRAVSVIWQRVLEEVRIITLYAEFSGPWRYIIDIPGRPRSILCSSWTAEDPTFVENLILYGANPNANCPNVSGDPGASTISALTGLLLFMKRLEELKLQNRSFPSGGDHCLKHVKQIILFLQAAGAREMVEPQDVGGQDLATEGISGL